MNDEHTLGSISRENGASVFLWGGLLLFSIFHFLPLDDSSPDRGWTIWREMIKHVESGTILQPSFATSYLALLSLSVLLVSAPFVARALRAYPVVLRLALVIATLTFVLALGAGVLGGKQGPAPLCFLIAQLCNLVGLHSVRPARLAPPGAARDVP